jgi:phosphoglycolate phosphatase-like HAD superfamily hydrolase
MAVEAALLDVDGTLIDSNYQHALAWYLAFRRHDILLPLWRMAGVETLCVITGGWSKQELREAGAIAVFESVDELRQRLEETPLL